MARKIPDEKKREIELRDELEKMLADGIDNLQFDINNAKELLPQQGSSFMDYERVKTYADDKAKSIVDSIAEFYLNENIIAQIPYVNQKSVVDKITVSNLLFQMKTAEHAIIKLLEEIDNGNLHPRTFEVLASLQRSKMEIVKHLAQFMVIMENNYKSLKEDYRVKIADEPPLLEAGSAEEDNSQKSAFQIRGTKQMIEMLREAVPEKRAAANPYEIKEEEETDGEG
jgi:hypothetical protein